MKYSGSIRHEMCMWHTEEKDFSKSKKIIKGSENLFLKRNDVEKQTLKLER